MQTSEPISSMTPAGIVEALSVFGGLPREALAAARQQRSDVTPLFLQAIQDFIEGGPRSPSRPGPLFFAFHLLGEWRETAAYRPLCRLLRQPMESLEREMGDEFSTATLPHVMAAVCDGDPGPLFDVILDPGADEFIRWSSFSALVVAVVNGILAREQVTAFLRESFDALRPKEENGVWAGWMEAVECLGVQELAPMVKQLFETGYVSESLMEFSDFEEGLNRALASPTGIRPPDRSGEYALFEDTIAELSEWSFAKDNGADEYGEGEEYEEPDAFPFADAPHLNPLRDVGRNDPCPCGSGKKFKKCCLGAAV